MNNFRIFAITLLILALFGSSNFQFWSSWSSSIFRIFDFGALGALDFCKWHGALEKNRKFENKKPAMVWSDFKKSGAKFGFRFLLEFRGSHKGFLDYKAYSVRYRFSNELALKKSFLNKYQWLEINL